MGMFNAVESSIKKYGGAVKICQNGSEFLTRAFVEPLRYRNKIYIGGEYHQLGFMRREKYLYIGTADIRLKENASVIESNGSKYIVKRCETYYVKDYPVYEWGILVPYGEALEDEYDSN